MKKLFSNKSDQALSICTEKSLKVPRTASVCVAVTAAKSDICVDDGESRIGSAVDGQLVDAGDDVHVARIIHVIQIGYDQTSVQVDIDRFADGGGIVETQVRDLR